MILVTPDWNDQYWSRLLDKISIARVEIPSGTKLYVGDWGKEPLPAPPWNTYVSLVDTVVRKVPLAELNPKMVQQVQKASRAWGFEELEREVRKYPRTILEETMDKEVQVEGLGEKIANWLDDMPCDPQLDPPTHCIDLAHPIIDPLVVVEPRAVLQHSQPALPTAHAQIDAHALDHSMDLRMDSKMDHRVDQALDIASGSHIDALDSHIDALGAALDTSLDSYMDSGMDL